MMQSAGKEGEEGTGGFKEGGTPLWSWKGAAGREGKREEKRSPPAPTAASAAAAAASAAAAATSAAATAAVDVQLCFLCCNLLLMPSDLGEGGERRGGTGGAGELACTETLK
ncbi:unnamed protein product [Closterium sp. NIES-54]